MLVLRNHGVVTGGETIEEALYLMHNVVSACESQIKLMVVGVDNMQMLSEEAIKQVRSIIKSAGVQVQGKPDQTDQDQQKTDESKARKWKIWDLEFEARMRMLDNAVSCFLLLISFSLRHPELRRLFMQSSLCHSHVFAMNRASEQAICIDSHCCAMSSSRAPSTTSRSRHQLRLAP